MYIDEQAKRKLLAILDQLSDQIYVFMDNGGIIKGPMIGEIKFPERLTQGEVFSFGQNLF